MPRLIVNLSAALMSLLFMDFPAFAWGERGHDVITRVAARLVEAKKPKSSFAQLLIQKENMLGHLSNVPDIVWRSLDKKVVDANGPTHFIDVDYLVDDVKLRNLPLLYLEAAKIAQQRNKSLDTEVGTAPWRSLQLWTSIWTSLSDIKSPGASNKSDLEKNVNDTLLYAGLLSHFIGDLAQPLHTTSDYDGWNRNQGGLHSYFESLSVDQIDLSLDDQVFSAAVKSQPSDRIKKEIASEKLVSSDPLHLVWGLVVDSYRENEQLFSIDKKSVIRTDSKKDPLKIPAKRIDAGSGRAFYSDLIVSRMAVAADVLSDLWLLAWTKAKSPDLSQYQSFRYPVAPDFVPVSYRN